ncbi:acyl-CoA dehydrogenase family protein [Cellulomonas sp. PhB143]|uniref:acyl-CoA dehydrogenase family protein n=1 Tax=Cellulomonas sp. PhB143 TaxID=2485186 RepID=UPI000F47838D|nr:acyl-CoA dehydrogenase family protein [Cellulomonas sp. PhB143]ROS78648.1 alkylation response protein AidB-like acyl-CoA dehydrogenase [Cellulomonas sp. PhB143]
MPGPSATPTDRVWPDLGGGPPAGALERALAAPPDPLDVGAALAWAVGLGGDVPPPGGGRTGEAWSLLASVALVDVGLARVVEPHLDALGILAQVPGPVDLAAVAADAGSSWGVFAAEGPGRRLEARPAPGGTWTLHGEKPWCSLAGALSHALVTAWTPDGRRLFAVGLRADGVAADDGPWVARGLRQVVSAPVRFDGARAVPVGEAGWYLERPGFAWGGIGVAACWFGGAAGVHAAMAEASRGREPDQVALAHLGAADTVLHGARAVLREAAAEADRGSPAPAVLARRARGVVARAAEDVLRHAAHALGPGPLTTDEGFARRAADLALYLRQHHAERDDASLGRAVLERGPAA